MSDFDPRDLPLSPPVPSSCLPPVHVDKTGVAVPDPYAVLELEPGATPGNIREAFRDQLLAHPPEQSPKQARRIREARDRLIDDAQFAARRLGVLHVPDIAALGLPRPGRESEHPLTPEARLLGQAVLYTLVEEALWTNGLGQRFEDALAATDTPT